MILSFEDWWKYVKINHFQSVIKVTCRLYKKLPLLKGNVTEAVARRCSVKKVFLEISQNSQENTCARVSFLTKLQTQGLQLY